MKLIVPALFMLLLVSSCKKQDPDTVLTGTWRLVQTVNEVNGTISLPPANANRYITITFKNDGSFAGNTIANEIAGTYKIENGRDLDIMLGFVTKIAEDDWGRNFCDALMSCYYQSVSPCIKPSYEIKNGNLIIHSVADYDLILAR